MRAGVVALTGEFLRFQMGLSNAANYAWIMQWLQDEFYVCIMPSSSMLPHDNALQHWTDNGEYQDLSGVWGIASYHIA